MDISEQIFRFVPLTNKPYCYAYVPSHTANRKGKPVKIEAHVRVKPGCKDKVPPLKKTKAAAAAPKYRAVKRGPTEAQSVQSVSVNPRVARKSGKTSGATTFGASIRSRRKRKT